MLNLPKSTVFNKRIPKQKFYDNITINTALKKIFIDCIKSIHWTNKIAPTTLNLEAGENVTEIEVFEIRLNQKYLDEKVLLQIDKEIPYHIVFCLEYDGEYQLWIGYKEAINSKNSVFKVNKYYSTEWLKPSEIELSIDGINMDLVYENFVKQIAGSKLDVLKTETLKESLERSEREQKLKKKIQSLELKLRNEKQLNRQIEINAELKKIRKELG